MKSYTVVRTIRRLATVLAITTVALGSGALPSGAFGATFDGIVVFANVFDVRAGVSGRVESSRLVAGMHLPRGEELASVDAALYQMRLDDAKRRLALMQAEFDEAEKAFERSEILFDEGSMSLVEFDHSQLLVQRAGVNLSQARGDQLTASHHAQLSRILTPFESVVLDTHVSSGQFVNAAFDAPRIATLAERGRYAVRVNLDAAQRLGIALGDEARVMVNGEELPAKVGAIRHDPAGTPVTWWMDVVFQSDSTTIVAGLTAQVAFP
jgi:multidrug efflux pump subunit AcrA (membrane-fusion protein)